MTQARVAEYGTTRIPFTLVRRERATLSIEVKPDGQVQVIAPLLTPEEDIRLRVEKRGAWILREQREVQALPVPLPARQYVSGEAHRYLGRQHRLRVLIGREEGVRVTRGELLVTVRSAQRAERVLNRWYRARAQVILTERMTHCLETVAHHGIQHDGTFTLRRMRTHWGSCTRSGHLTLNPLLVQAPKDCIDYVLIHELCHLAEFNHARNYYSLLSRILPDWKARRARLNRLVDLPAGTL
ncbi:M48 family metallopeptidase [Deinococcus altitudinis]|uniref:M48 family metallopeptidase n=1 Tax=Deinococcus altitudinis TaxID=468914 RepID=UPI003891449A